MTGQPGSGLNLSKSSVKTDAVQKVGTGGVSVKYMTRRKESEGG